MGSQGLRHIFVLELERFDELICNFAILGYFELDLFLQSTIASRFHIYLSAELFLFFGEIAPLWIIFEVLSVVYLLILAHSLRLLVLAALTATGSTEGAFLIAHNPQCVLHLLYFVKSRAYPARTNTSNTPVILLIVVALTLAFEFLGLNKLLDLVHICESFRSEEPQLVDCFAECSFFENAMYKVCMLFSCIESRENLHLVYNLSVFLRLLALEFLHLFQVKQTALDYELFATNSLI